MLPIWAASPELAVVRALGPPLSEMRPVPLGTAIHPSCQIHTAGCALRMLQEHSNGDAAAEAACQVVELNMHTHSSWFSWDAVGCLLMTTSSSVCLGISCPCKLQVSTMRP